jgi:hypothetical protein
MYGEQDSKRIGEILVGLKALPRSDVDRVLEAMRKRQRKLKFGQMARGMGLINEEHVLAALAVQMHLLPGIERMSLEQILHQLLSESSAV